MLNQIAVFMSSGAVGSTAYQRWKGIQHIQSDTSFINNGYFQLAAMMILVTSVISLVAINLFRKSKDRKSAEKEFVDGVARRKLTAAETDTLIEIAIRAGLKRKADIFALSESFDKGLDILFKESFSDGNPTDRTVQLERHLAGLKAKMNFRRVAKGGGYYQGGSSWNKMEQRDAVPEQPVVARNVYIALFPFSMKMDFINNGNQSVPGQADFPPDGREQLPKFVPATITGLVGRVLFIETGLHARLGDRVLLVITSFSKDEDCSTIELVEEIGIVDRSVYLSSSAVESRVCRLGVNLSGLDESQKAKFTAMVMNKPEDTNTENSAENVTVPPASEDEMK